MFKITVVAALVAFLSACSSMPGSMSDSAGMSRTTMGAPGAAMGSGMSNPNNGGARSAY